jgi:5-oxoprolinase (ATP-hydrolysing)
VVQASPRLSSGEKINPFQKTFPCTARGENLLKRVDGETVRLGHRAFVEVKKGESIIIKTPGGGGYGKKGP